MKRWIAVLPLALLLAACSGDGSAPSPDSSTAPSTAVPSPTGPSRSAVPNPFVPGTIQAEGVGADGEALAWTVRVDAVEWVWPEAVHGDLSDGWIPSATVYLAADVEYTATAGTVLWTTSDWSFAGDDGTAGILSQAGGGGPEEAVSLPVAGELAEGESVRGRVHFAMTAATAGTLSYSTLADGEVGTWDVPTQ